jgi:hypothetical protein
MANYDKPGTSAFDRMAANPAAPAGLKQSAQRFGRAQQDYLAGDSQLQPWLPQSMMSTATQWYAGQNAEGVENGWDTQFYRDFWNQQSTWMNKAMEEKKSSVFYDQFDPAKNPSATGVALWDDPNGQFRFGDVFLNGTLQQGQNLYEVFDERTADNMVGQFLFDDYQNRRQFQKENPKGYSEEIQGLRKQYSEQAAYAKSAEQYQADLQRHEESIVKGRGDDLLVAGGATGGATLFAGVGAAIGAPFAGVGALPGAIIGGVVGSVVGGIGSWLNKDELTDLTARAATRQDQIKAEFAGAGELPAWGFAVEEWGNVGSKLISPTSNLWRGLNEVQMGGRDDQLVDWYKVDDEGNQLVPGWKQGVDLAATGADAVLQFSSAPGRALYMGQMGTVVAGKTTALGTGKGFNESQGQFDPYENPAEWGSAIGSVGIDTVQMATGGLLGRIARHDRAFVAGREASETAGSRWLPGSVNRRLAKWDEGEVIAGTRYTRAADGTMTTRLVPEAFAPSEATKALTVQFRARAAARRRGDLVTPDDMYNAAVELTQGSAWRTGLITGYGEALEEGVQAILDPLSVGETPVPTEVAKAAAYGGAAGMGMGWGALNRGPSVEQKLSEVQRRTYNIRTGESVSAQEWGEVKKGMSQRALDMLSIPTPEEDQAAEVVRETAQEGMKFRAAAESPVAQEGFPLIQQTSWEEAQKNANKLGGDAVTVHAATSEFLRAPGGPIEQMRFDANTAAMSFDQMITTMVKNAEALGTKVSRYTDQAAAYRAQAAELDAVLSDPGATQEEKDAAQSGRDRAMQDLARVESYLEDLTGINEAVRALIGDDSTTGELVQRYADFTAETDTGRGELMVDEMNARLTELYQKQAQLVDADGNLIDAEAVKRVVEFMLPRHPLIDQGSFAVFLPQVSKLLTKRNAHRTVYVHQSVLKALGADHDGDAFVQQFDLYVPREELENFRRGLQYFEQQAGPVAEAEGPVEKSWTLTMDVPDSEAAYVDLFGNQNLDVERKTQVELGFDRLRQKLMDRYAQPSGPINPRDMRTVLDAFFNRVRGQNPKARVKLAQEMWELEAEALFSMSDATGVPEVTHLWSLISANWESIQEHLGMIAFAQDPAIDKDDPGTRPADIARLDTRAQLQAATYGLSMAQLGGFEEPRPSQFLHYHALIQSAIDLTFNRRPETMDRTETSPEFVLAQMYANLGADKTETDLQTIQNHNSIERRVLNWISEIAQSTKNENNTHLDIRQLFLLISNIRVGNFEMDVESGEYSVDGNDITLLQLLLRRSLQIELEKNRGLADDSAKKKKIQRLTELCYPKAAHSNTAALAVVEVFGDLQLAELVGSDAFYIGPQMTLRQFHDMMLTKSVSAARHEFSGLKRVPGYFSHRGMPDPPWDITALSTLAEYQDGENVSGVPVVNGFTMLIDSLQSAVAAERARRQKQGKKAKDDFIDGLRDFQHQLDTWREMFAGEIKPVDGAMSRVAVYRHMLQRDPSVAKLIAELIPAASRRAVFDRVDGQLVEAQFIEDVMTNENLEDAAEKYFVFTKLAEWNQLLGTPVSLDALAHWDADNQQWVVPKVEQVADEARVGRVNPKMIKSRFLETMYFLNTLPDGGHELRRFLNTMFQSESLDELYEAINNEPVWLFGRAELSPFVDSVEEFELTPSDVYQAGSTDMELRETLADFQSIMHRRANALDESRNIVTGNKVTLQHMVDLLADQEQKVRLLVSQGIHPEDAWRQVRSQETDTTYNNLLMYLEQSIDNARLFGDAVGPNAREQAMRAFHEMLIRLHDKGKSDPQLSGLGDALASIDTIGFGTALTLEMNAVHSYDWKAVASSPTMLANGPVRVQLKDGSELTIDLSTLRGALEALMDPATQAFARAVLFPVTRDINSLNVVQLYQDSEHASSKPGKPSDLGQMMKEASFAHVFQTSSGNELDKSWQLITYVESFIRRQAIEEGSDVDGFYPIQRMLNTILEAYQTTAGTGRGERAAEQLRNTLVVHVANALKSIGTLQDPKLLDRLKAEVAAIMQEKMWGDTSALEELFLSNVEEGEREATRDMLVTAVIQRNKVETLAAGARLADARATGNAGLITEAEREYQEHLDRAMAFEQSGHDLRFAGSILARDFESIRQSFSLSHDPGQRTEDTMKKAALVRFLSEGGRVIKFQGVKAKISINDGEREEAFSALLDKFRDVAFKPQGSLDDIETWDPLVAEEWDQLAIWATLVYFEERTTRSANDVKAAPAIAGNVHEFARLHDDTWSFLVDGLFIPQVHTAVKMMVDLGRNQGFIDPQKRKTNTEDIARQITGTILNEKLLGEWNSRVPVNILKMELAMRQTRVGTEVPKAGNYPKIFGPWVGAFRPSFRLPDPAEHYSTADLVVNPDQSAQLVFDQFAYARLHHHFVSTVQLIPTADPAQPIDITTRVSDVDMTNDETQNSGLRVFDTALLFKHADQLAKTEDLLKQGYTIHIEYVDVDKKPYSRDWANNRFFDGRGRNPAARSEISQIAAMIFGPNAESKLLQQGPLDMLASGGAVPPAFKNADLQVVLNMETGEVADIMKRKAWHLLTRKYPMSVFFLDDFPAMYQYVKSRHVIVGRNTDTGKKEVWWAERYITAQATGQPIPLESLTEPGKPPKLVALSESNAQKLLGGTGFDPYDPQQPVLNLDEMDVFPELGEARLRELGLERLGEEATLRDAPVTQFLPLARARRRPPGEKPTKGKFAQNLAQWVRNGEQEAERRSRLREKAEGKLDIAAVNKRGWKTISKLLKVEDIGKQLKRLGVPFEDMSDPIGLMKSWQAYSKIQDRLGPNGMIWEFKEDLDSTQVVDGVLGRVSFDENFFQNASTKPSYGDVVIIDLESILSWHGYDEVTAATRAIEIVDAFAREGVIIMLGSSRSASDLRKEVSTYMLTGPMPIEYRSMNDGSGNFYEPITEDREYDATAASLTSSRIAIHQEAFQNINVNLITEDMAINEGARIVNDNFSELFRRVSMQLVPTNLMLGVSSDNVLAFGRPIQQATAVGDQFTKIAKQLLDFAAQPEGRATLLGMLGEYDSSIPIYKEHPNGTYTPGVRDPEEALDRFLDALSAGQDPLAPGRTVLSGDLFLLVGSDGSVLIHRLGFRLPNNLDKGHIVGQWSTPLNGERGGLRVAIPRPAVEANATLLPPFTIDDIRPDHRGQMLHGKFELGWAQKMLAHGVKTTLVPMAEDEQFVGPLSVYKDNTVHIGSMTGRKGQEDKAGMRNVVSDFKTLFAFTGADFRADLVNLLMPDDTRSFSEKWNELEAFLNRYAAMNNSLSVEEADDILSSSTSTFAYLQQLNAEGRAELGDAWVDLVASDQQSTTLTDEQRLGQILLVTMSIAGISPNQVVSNPGVLTVRNDKVTNAVVGFLPSVMTDAMSNPTWPGLHSMLIKRANSVLTKYTDDAGVEHTGSWFDDAFTFHTTLIRTLPDGSKRELIKTGLLQLETPLPADENPITLAFGVVMSRDASVHNARVASTQGMQTVTREPRDQFGDEQIMRFNSDDQTVWDLITRIVPPPTDYYPAKYLMPMEQVHWDKADEKLGRYTQPLSRDPKDMDNWNNTGQAKELLDVLGLHPTADMIEIDYLVRQWLGAPAPLEGEIDPVTPEMYRQAVVSMLQNVQRGWHPLHGADVPHESNTFWRKIFLAQASRTDGKAWAPMKLDGKKKHKAEYDWSEWVDVLFGQVQNSNKQFHAMFRVDTDGFFHTFQYSTPLLANMPASLDPEVLAKLQDPETNELYLSVDPGVRIQMREPAILESMNQTWEVMAGHEAAFDGDVASDVPASSIFYRNTQRENWLKKNHLGRQKKTTYRDYAKQGVEYRENLQNTNMALRSIVHMSIITRLANPALWTSAIIEVHMRNQMNNVTEFLLGQNVGISGRAMSRLQESSFGQLVGLDQIKLTYTPEQIKLILKIAEQLGADPKWRGELFGEMTYQNMIIPTEFEDEEGQISRGGRIARTLEKWAGTTARVYNDPTLGQRKTAAAKRYILGALEYMAATNNSISLETLAQELEADPMWLKKQFSREEFNPHRAGVAQVAQVRSTKGTVLGDMIMRPIDSLYASDSTMKAIVGTMLKIPFMFTRFNVNALTTLTGMTAADQGLAMFLDGRQTPNSIRKVAAAARRGETIEPEYFEFTDVLETLDLQKLVLRGAITQTGLVALGLMGANILGLGGEDEEERRRRRMERYLNLPHFYDPREAQNDFLYADSMWLDSIPILNTIFSREYDGESRSAVVPHWMIRQFTSPLMGTVRFFEDGDIRNIGWGFLDAASAIPTSVQNLWRDANLNASLLVSDLEALDSEGIETPEAINRRQWMIATLVGMYERPLLENQFINGLRSAFDDVDRNPYAIPAERKNGELVTEIGVGGNRYPVSQKEAMEQYQGDQIVDPVTGDPVIDPNTGQPIANENRLRYAKRSGMDAIFHQYAEGNATAAVLLSLFTGQWGSDSSFRRENMVPKQPLVPTEELNRAEAEALILAAWQGRGGQDRFTKEEIIRGLKYQTEQAGGWWQQSEIEARANTLYKLYNSPKYALSIMDKNNMEVITKDGADGVYTGLWNGTIDFDSPTLQGLSIPYEMRRQIGVEWLQQIKQESIDMGMSEESAMYRVRRFWYGDDVTGRPGFREMLYNDKIPAIPVAKYTQLNVTYTIGPDGKPWATPFTRNTLSQLFLPTPHTVAPPAQGTRLDSRGNIVNELTQTNTGLKAVVPSFIVDDLEAEDDILEEVEKKRTTPGWTSKYNGYYGGYRRGYGGYSRGGYSRGGYSGSSYNGPALFTDKILRSIRGGYGPQMDGQYTPKADNPIVRRASVRRERYSSERGRLKQWQ